MNRCSAKTVSAFIFVGFLSSLSGIGEEINHAKFLAQQAALPALEGRDPFILRESWLNGSMKPGTAKLVPQQLFKSNIYQFWFAVANPRSGVQLNIYDGEGNLLVAETVKYPLQKNVISLRLTPEKTGTYYLRLAVTKDTDSVQDWALIYAYK